MKAIILAAGMGTRLMPLTKDNAMVGLKLNDGFNISINLNSVWMGNSPW